MKFDGKALAEQMLTAVKDYVGRATKALRDEIQALERKMQEIPAGPPGPRGEPGPPGDRGEPGAAKDGLSAYELACKHGFSGTEQQWLESLRGKNADIAELAPLLSEAIKAIPLPRDGRDGTSVTVEDVRPLIEEAVKAIPVPKDGKDGADGKSVTAEDVRPILEEAVKAIPVPRDGKDGTSVTLDDVRPLIEQAVKSIPAPKDGRDGSDGKSVTVDDIRPLFDSALATWALDFERRAQDTLQRAVDRMPVAKDGKDGRDAFDLEDIQIQLADDDRTLTLAFVRGEQRVERSVILNHPIYRGVHKTGEKYVRGDTVTWGGSTWIAMRDTDTKPETDDSWRLSVKKGRDGKDGQKGEPGPKGRDGKDFRPPMGAAL